MADDQTQEMTGNLVAFARRLASKEELASPDFTKELIELYSQFLRNQGYFVVRRERLHVFNHNYMIDRNSLQLSKVGDVEFINHVDKKIANELMLKVLQHKDIFIEQRACDPGENGAFVRHYQLAVIAPKVIK